MITILRSERIEKNQKIKPLIVPKEKPQKKSERQNNIIPIALNALTYLKICSGIVTNLFTSSFFDKR